MSVVDTCGLHGDKQAFVVLLVEERHKPCPSVEAAIDEQLLFEVPHRAADVHRHNAPAVELELMNHHPAEVFAVHSVVASERGGVEIEDDFLIFEIMVIVAELYLKSN